MVLPLDWMLPEHPVYWRDLRSLFAKTGDKQNPI